MTMKTHGHWSARVLATALVAAACGSTPTAPRPPATRAFDAIAASIRGEIAAGRLTGVSVALVHRGRIVWEDGFGWADRAGGRSATSRTPFSIASITKSFTTTAVMTLVAAGKLELDRPANDYLGEAKIVDANGPVREVTVRRLASHSSGLPVLFAMYPGGDGQPSVAALLRDYGRIVAPVGERYEYSNIAMAALGEIVARRSGEELGQYLQNHVLTPLGLADSFFDTDVSRRPAMAVRYQDDGAPFPFYLTATPASGEMYASAHDLARYAMFHLEDPGFTSTPLSGAQIDELHRAVTAVEPPMHHYAMGWRVLRRPGERDVIYHGGGQLGVAAKLVLVPSSDAACVVLSNRRNNRDFIDGVCDRMLQTVVPEWRGFPSSPDPAPQPLAPLADYRADWRGELIAQRRRIVVQLRIEDDRRGQLVIGDGPAAPVTDLGLLDGVVVGNSVGDIDSPEVRRNHLHDLSLKLKLRGTVLDGEILAGAADATLPHWVELRRQPQRLDAR